LNGQYAESLAGWQEYAKLFPDNTVAPRFIQRNIAQIHEQRMQKAKDAARIAADPQAAEAKRQEAEEQKQSAIAVWKQMRDEGDPYGDYRILRLEALDLAEQKRYMEAVAVLDKARWESPSNFDEASEFMIKIKQEGNLPLSVSEKKAVLRQEEGDTCPGMPAPVPAEKG
jgi:tetratricopeptide (TPR) repeat protein